MSELITTYNEKDLFTYFQKTRLLAAKRLNDANIADTTEVEEEKVTFKSAMDNLHKKIKRSANGYDQKGEAIAKAIQDFETNHPEIIDLSAAEGLVSGLFDGDEYGLTKLVFATSIILDDEYDYKYVEEGLKDVSVLLYGDEQTLLVIKKQLFENFNAISPKSLSNVQKGILIGVAASAAIGVIGMPLILAPTTAAAAGLLSHSFIVGGALTLESLFVGAAITGIVYGGMKLYNNEKVKEEFKKLSPEKNALYLAIQCTYIQRIKEQLSEDEFKEQLDLILKNLSTLKGDLDYYYFVEKESTVENKAKIDSFHSFDNRLARVLEIK